MDEMTYATIKNLVMQGLISEDEDERELVVDLVKAAVDYTEMRVKWSYISRDEKIETDSLRTSKHNRMIDAFNIFLRYEGKTGKESVDLSGLDRKTIGDIGNRLVMDIAISER